MYMGIPTFLPIIVVLKVHDAIFFCISKLISLYVFIPFGSNLFIVNLKYQWNYNDFLILHKHLVLCTF